MWCGVTEILALLKVTGILISVLSLNLIFLKVPYTITTFPNFIVLILSFSLIVIRFSTVENLLKFRDITLTKDLDRDLFSRYSGKIPQDVSPSRIICVILEEGSGAPGGYSIYGNNIAAFYFNYKITATRKAKIIYY